MRDVVAPDSDHSRWIDRRKQIQLIYRAGGPADTVFPERTAGEFPYCAVVLDDAVLSSAAALVNERTSPMLPPSICVCSYSWRDETWLLHLAGHFGRTHSIEDGLPPPDSSLRRSKACPVPRYGAGVQG